MIRPAIDVAEEAIMGSFVNPNPGPPAHPTGTRCPALTGPTTEDAEAAADATNLNLSVGLDPVIGPLKKQSPDAPPIFCQHVAGRCSKTALGPIR